MAVCPPSASSSTRHTSPAKLHFLAPVTNAKTDGKRPKRSSYANLSKALNASPLAASADASADSGYSSGQANDSGSGIPVVHAPKPFQPDPQESYYLLHALVGLELNWEKQRLFRLAWDQPDVASERASLSSKFTDEISMEDLPRDRLPLLSFMLHFLLRAPLVRDVGYRAQSLDQQRAAEPAMLFWHAGLSPLLRAIKGLDLSPREEYGERGFVAQFTDAIFNGLQDFITAGLNFTHTDLPVSSASSFRGPPLRSPLPRTRCSSDNSPRSSVSRDTESPTFSRLFFSPGSPESKASLRMHRSEDVLRKGGSAPLDEDMERMRKGTEMLRRGSIRHSFLARSSSPNLSTLHSASDGAVTSESEGDEDKAQLERAHRLDVAHGKLKAHTAHEDFLDVAAITTPQDLSPLGSPTIGACSSEGEPTVKLVSSSAAFDQPPPVPALPSVDHLPLHLPLPPSPYLNSNSSMDEVIADDDEEDECAFDPFERYVVDHKARRSFSSSSEDEMQTYVTPVATSSKAPAPPDAPVQPPKASFKRRFTLSFSRKPAKGINIKKTSYPSLTAQPAPLPTNEASLHASASLDQLREQREKAYYMGNTRILPLELPEEHSRQSIIEHALLPHLRAENDLVIPKAPHPWPFSAPFQPSKDLAVHQLKYGGYQTDVVACRESSFGKYSFVIRTRRPHRMDEFVVRNISDLTKIQAALEKKFPDVAIRRILLDGESSLTDDPQENSIERLQDTPFQLRPPDHGRDRSSMSRLSLRFLEAAKERPQSVLGVTALEDGRKRRRTSTMSTLRSLTPTDIGRDLEGGERHSDKLRRALRSWVRDLVSIRGLASHSLVATLLLSNPITLKEHDLRAIQQSQAIDEIRRRDRKQRAESAATRARLAHMFWHSVNEEVVRQDGLDVLSDLLRRQPIAANLPIRFTKSLEWMRWSFATFLYDTLVAGPPTSFAKLEKLHSAIPWFKIRQVFKVASKKSILSRALADVFLSKPFGAKSLLQRLISILIDNDATPEEISQCHSRLGSWAISAKIEAFVQAPEDVKSNIRVHAQLNDLPLVVTIARGAEEPRLDTVDVERVMTAARHYERLVKKGTSRSALRNNMHVRLLLDMQLYLRLLSQQRDAQKIRHLLENPMLAESMEVLLQPVISLLQRVNSHGNLTTLMTELQSFLDHLISLVKALRTRAQDSSDGVRLISNLIQKYQQSFYDFVHRVHLVDPIIDELFGWLRQIFQYLQSDVHNLLPLSIITPRSSEEQDKLEIELERLCDFYEQRRSYEYQNLCRYYAGDVKGDDPISCQGDGLGRTDQDWGLNTAAPIRPLLEQIPKHLDKFRKCLNTVFRKYAFL